MPLWLCLRFDQLSLEALRIATDDAVIVVASQRVLSCNDEAAAWGVRTGQSTQTAVGLLNAQPYQLLERSLEREQETLTQLESWGYSITPSVTRWREHCLQLEISGCLRLFGGFEGLLATVQSDLAQRDVHFQAGVANSRPGAWLTSFLDHETAISIERPLAERIADLPLSLLTDFDKDTQRLAKAGIRTHGNLIALNSASLRRRCGRALTHWLDVLTGRTEEAWEDYRPPMTFSDSRWFGFDIQQRQELLPAMQELLEGLTRFLYHRQLSCQHIEWQLLRFRGGPTTFSVQRSHEAPTEWQTWLALSTLRLDNIEIGRDIEGIALHAKQLQTRTAQHSDLFVTPRHQEPLNHLVDRLRSRLGQQAVHYLAMRAEHIPELCVFTSETPLGEAHPQEPRAQRPFWLLPQPLPLREEKGALCWQGPLQLIYGPERIEDGWWQTPICRDYYIAEGAQGQRIWVFQNRHNQRWYLQGLFP